MNEWLKSMVGYYLLVSIVMQMLPGKKYEQYVRLFTGFLLILVLARPILKINSAETVLEKRFEQILQEHEDIEREVANKGMELFEDGGDSGNNKIDGMEYAGERSVTEPVEIAPIPGVEVNVGN